MQYKQVLEDGLGFPIILSTTLDPSKLGISALSLHFCSFQITLGLVAEVRMLTYLDLYATEKKQSMLICHHRQESC